MCNFYGMRVTGKMFLKLLQLEKELGTIVALNRLMEGTVFDGFGYDDHAIMVKDGNDFKVVMAHWEFVPNFVQNLDELALYRKGINPKTMVKKQPIPWLNAKSENLLESKMWRPAALKNRCLIPATHFFEWQHYKPKWAKKDSAYPYLIRTYDDYFYMAGIYNDWVNKDTGEVITSYAIVTTKANELMTFIHNKKERMPTILPESLAYEWLMTDLTEERIQELASYQLPPSQMTAYTVAKDFKIAEDPTAPFDYPELPPIDVAV